MKKGSKARKCDECGRIVFWSIPKRNWGIFMECDQKKVYGFKYRCNHLWCIDCYNKAVAEGRCEK